MSGTVFLKMGRAVCHLPLPLHLYIGSAVMIALCVRGHDRALISPYLYGIWSFVTLQEKNICIFLLKAFQRIPSAC